MDFCSLSLQDLQLWMQKNKKNTFRAKQIFEWVYKKKVLDFSKMTNLDKELRLLLQKKFYLPSIQLVCEKKSKDKETIKYLWKLKSGDFVESVLILSNNRKTVCVSSQVGCSVGCKFCASGKMGFFRNLTDSEIIEQILYIDSILQKNNENVTHVVFMGMGEPLLNYNAVVKTIEKLISKECIGISQRRISISTVGVVKNIYRFIQEKDWKINLVISLHAPTQELREKLIPYAKKYSLKEIFESANAYFKKTGRDITYEYTLIKDVNDTTEHAKALVSLLKKQRHCTVNLIPYNPIEGGFLMRSKISSIKEFEQVLIRNRVITTCRYTKGTDINAACGQLTLKKQDFQKND